MRSRRTIAVTLGLLVCCFAVQGARADFTTSVTPVVTPMVGGGFSYDYTVTNSPTSTMDIGAFYLDVSAEADLDAITMPTGFLTLYTPGYETIEFASTDSSSDITPGSSDVFTFTSPLGPTLISYANQSYDGDGAFDTGNTLGPADVPEPATIGVMLLGTGLLVRRRRQSSGGSTSCAELGRGTIGSAEDRCGL